MEGIWKYGTQKWEIQIWLLDENPAVGNNLTAGDAEEVIPRSDDEEEEDLPADPDSRSTSTLVEEAAASTGISKRRIGAEEEARTAAKRARGVERI